MLRGLGQALCLLVLLTPIAQAAERVALVVGNGAYEAATPLPNPLNDARDVAAALERLGFEVTLATDLDKAGFDAAILAFGKALKGAEVGLFFYAGHGMQVAGTNYLLPVDAQLIDEIDLYLRTIDLNLITGLLEQSVKTALVMLDACRDNPMAQTLARSMGTRSSSVGRGLAQVDAGLGTLIAYATQPGNVALDGEGKNSPFAAALLQHIETPGIEINLLMTRVRLNVIEATNRQQHPWVHTSLLGEFYFVEQQAAVPPASAPAPAPTDDRQAEIVFWQSIQNSTDWRDFQAYIDRFGAEGIYYDLALRRTQKLKAEEEALVAEAGPTLAEKPTQEGAQQAALVGGGKVGDVKASLETAIGQENLAQSTYTLDGNALRDVSIPTPDGKAITAKEITFLALDSEHEEPHFMDVRVTGLSVELPPDEIPGVTRLNGDIVYAYEFDPAAKTLTVPYTHFSFPGLTTLTVSATFTEVAQLGGATPDEAMSGLAGAKLADLRVVWADETVLRAMLEQTAASQGMTLDQFRSSFAQALPALEPHMTGDVARMVLAAAKTIVDKVDDITVTVVADPAEPFPLAGFLALAMGPDGMPDFAALTPLNLSISAEQVASGTLAPTGAAQPPHGCDCLEVTNYTFMRRLVDGERRLVVAGELVNRTAENLAVPRLQARVLDEHGNEILSWEFAADESSLSPGAVGRFQSQHKHPDYLDEINVEVVFLPTD